MTLRYCANFGCWNTAGARGLCARCRGGAAQVGRNAKRQDPEEGLGPKDEHAVAEGDAPETSIAQTSEVNND